VTVLAIKNSAITAAKQFIIIIIIIEAFVTRLLQLKNKQVRFGLCVLRYISRMDNSKSYERIVVIFFYTSIGFSARKNLLTQGSDPDRIADPGRGINTGASVNCYLRC